MQDDPLGGCRGVVSGCALMLALGAAIIAIWVLAPFVLQEVIGHG